MKLPSSVALLFSLGTLCFADPINLDEINSNKIDYSLPEFKKESRAFDVINEDSIENEEWPVYMGWMCDLKNNISDFKIAVNSFSNGISNGNTQYVYLNLDKISNERKVEIIFYKHKF